MAIDDSIMLGLMAASISAVVAALERTRAALAPYRGARTDIGTPDTLDVFCGKGSAGGTFTTGKSGSDLFPGSGEKGTDVGTFALPEFGDLKSALGRRRELFGDYDGSQHNG